jgi:hypothetical protein
MARRVADRGKPIKPKRRTGRNEPRIHQGTNQMNPNIKRFDPVQYYDQGGSGYGQMQVDPDGDYVQYEDHEREVNGLREVIAKMRYNIIRKSTGRVVGQDFSHSEAMGFLADHPNGYRIEPC